MNRDVASFEVVPVMFGGGPPQKRLVPHGHGVHSVRKDFGCWGRCSSFVHFSKFSWLSSRRDALVGSVIRGLWDRLELGSLRFDGVPELEFGCGGVAGCGNLWEGV